ncbi:MgtC/SapB family protein [bacterium]|nr:MgtC/SapB family protein [bacterium]
MNLLPLPIYEVALRLFVSLFLSAIVGWQREIAQRPAGLRTHMLVCLGSTLLTIVSVSIVGTDPMRLASGIVTGIGFIGAGTIIRSTPTEVRGLTTAASIWMIAGVGIAVGVGFYWGAIIATFFAYIILVLLKRVERGFHRERERIITIEGKNRPGLLGEIGTILGNYGIDIRDIELKIEVEIATIELRVDIPSIEGIDEVIQKIKELEGVGTVKLSRE